MLPAITSNRIGNDNWVRHRFTSELDRLMDDFFGRRYTSPASEVWSPVTDLYEVEDAYALEMELPGFEREHVDISVENGHLIVNGRRPGAENEEEVTYHVRERTPARFSRSFALPTSVDQDGVDAELTNGLLRITLPKVAEAQPRRIEVKAR